MTTVTPRMCTYKHTSSSQGNILFPVWKLVWAPVNTSNYMVTTMTNQRPCCTFFLCFQSHLGHKRRFVLLGGVLALPPFFVKLLTMWNSGNSGMRRLWYRFIVIVIVKQADWNNIWTKHVDSTNFKIKHIDSMKISVFLTPQSVFCIYTTIFCLPPQIEFLF